MPSRGPGSLESTPRPRSPLESDMFVQSTKLKSLSLFLIFAQTHRRTLIVLESRWVKVPCICSLCICVVAMGEPRWIRSQDSPPQKGGVLKV